jgi:hypothetical protein
MGMSTYFDDSDQITILKYTSKTRANFITVIQNRFKYILKIISLCP